MPLPEPIPITGCRHDSFGHALKALGILRALNLCAIDEFRDRDAEGWWDTNTGVFYIRSSKYPSWGDLTRFFEQYYQPSLVFSPWNTGGGLDDKQEGVIVFTKLVQKRGGEPKPAKPTDQDVRRLVHFLFKNRKQLSTAGLEVRKKIRTIRDKLPAAGEFAFVLKNQDALAQLIPTDGVLLSLRQKTSGDKAVMARVQETLKDDARVQTALGLGREFFQRFQATQSPQEQRELFVVYRDRLGESQAAALDAVFAAHSIRAEGNPAFLDRGKAGNSEIFRSFWGYFIEFQNSRGPQTEAALRGGLAGQFVGTEAPGAPFFPDQIKTYNNGLGWILSAFPFCALDYLLAVEGALALRGSAARLLGALHGNFGAFPFLFETADEMTDDSGEVKRTALSLWFPIWMRPVTFAELESFILDSQARLPGREARFTAEFARAVRSQGVDAGFAGYQEFRFKMKGARVPWVCTGRYLAVSGAQVHTESAELLLPLDEVGFLDQLQVDVRRGRVHRRLLAKILDAVENAMSESEPQRYLTVLECLFEVTNLLSVSKRFRETVERQPAYLPPLPQEPWLDALRGLESEPEFEIARAVASVVGQMPQRDGTWSAVEPFLGSILPLHLSSRNWYLPKTPSPQAVWSGADLCLDLTRVLARRYHDSRTDDEPALWSAYPARLGTVLRFLAGELNDARIARTIEALSLVDWRPHRNLPHITFSENVEDAEPDRPTPLAYAAVRSLIEVERSRAVEGIEPRRRSSLRTLALLRERSSSGVSTATLEALHRLSIVGVPNAYGAISREENLRLTGRDIVRIERGTLRVSETFAARLAAAVFVPLSRRDHFTIFRAITIPQDKESNQTS